jgi:nicotinate-nucleotide adenylyltransferase
MATLYFGGSFNPIHHGHLICARAVAALKNFDQVALVPSFQPPHKPNAANMAGALDRLTMCRLAVAGDPTFAVEDLELLRPGPSYTLDTVRALKARGEQEIWWLIGADMLLYLPGWHQSADLLAEVNFIAVARLGWEFDWQALPPEFRRLESNVVQAPLIQIGSTDIRRRVAEGLSIDYLTPPAVCRYIRNHGLYRTDK